jgi:fatty-acid peroxygenase
MTASRTTRAARRPQLAATVVHTGLDRSVGLLRGGYPYLLRLRRRWQAPTAEIRVLGRRTTVLSGPDGVHLFYNETVMRRAGALPRPLLRMLFGADAVHGLDDEEHRHRKAMFVDLLPPEAARDIAGYATDGWRACDGALDPVGVFDAAVDVHCAAICRWAGVPDEAVDRKLGRDLAAIVDGFGSLGLRQLRARRARHRVNRWARRLVMQARGGQRRVDPAGAVGRIASASGLDGALLPARIAGVELVNILRPTVAVAYFVAFAAHALHERPELRERLDGADDELYEAFAHELRRYYPFVPMLAARVRRPVTFQGRMLTPGRRVLLDVFGTLHDPELWDAPERFEPGRFLGAASVPEYYVPQGGGEVRAGHRCPGERVAVELIKSAARWMVERPAGATGNVRIPMNRLPTRPVADEG